MQALEQRIYKAYEIKIFATMTGFRLQAFQGAKAYLPVVKVDYERNSDVKLSGTSEVENLIDFLQKQIDKGLLIEIK